MTDRGKWAQEAKPEMLTNLQLSDLKLKICSILLKLMNDLTDSRGKWALESESKPEIQENHLHHKVISN